MFLGLCKLIPGQKHNLIRDIVKYLVFGIF
jgi:hypothetical protein